MFGLQRVPGSRLNLGQNSCQLAGWAVGQLRIWAVSAHLLLSPGWQGTKTDHHFPGMASSEECCGVSGAVCLSMPQPWLCRLGRGEGGSKAKSGPACKTRGVSWWEGRSLPLPSWTSVFPGLALP